MPRQKSTNLAVTREKLLESGLSLLEKKGYNATGLQEIATTAGVLKGSFYNYFPSKETFAVEVIRYYTVKHIARWEQLLDASSSQAPYMALVQVFVQLAGRYEGADPKKGCLIGNLAGEISEASEECRLAMKAAIDDFKAILTKRFACGQQTGRVRSDLSAVQLADVFWDAWQGSLLRMKIEKSAQPVKATLETLFERLLVPGHS